MVLLFVIGLLTALSPDHSARRQEAALGRWVRENYGENAIVAELGGNHFMYLMAHYARTKTIITLTIPMTTDNLTQLKHHRPDAIVLRGTADQRRVYAGYLEGRPELGFTAADISVILGTEYDFELFVRRDMAAVNSRGVEASLTAGHGSVARNLAR